MDQTEVQNSSEVQDQGSIGAEQKGKLFNQDEVNKIVRDRLSKEKGKIDTERETKYQERESELNKRAMTLQAREKLLNKGLPAGLIEAVNLSDEESLDRSLEIIGLYVQNNRIDDPKPDVVRPNITTGSVTQNSGANSVDPYREAMGLR